MNVKPSMGFMEAVKTCYSKYFNFQGRARRSEFWWFYLLSIVVNSVLFGIISIMHSSAAESFGKGITLDNFSEKLDEATALDAKFQLYYIITGVACLFLFSIPLIAAQVRRLHDVGKSGHLMWLCLLCGIGGLVPLILCIPDGQPQQNQYGPSPKYETDTQQPAEPPFM